MSRRPRSPTRRRGPHPRPRLPPLPRPPPRRPRRGARRSRCHSIQRALGLRRSAWAKVLPLGVRAPRLRARHRLRRHRRRCSPRRPPATVRRIQDVILPTYGEYFGYVSLLVALLVAFVAPEILCTDRRTGHGRPLPRLAAHPRHLPRGQGDRDGRGALADHDRAHRCSCWCLHHPGRGSRRPAGTCSSTVAPHRRQRARHHRLYTALSLGVSSLTDRKAFATVGADPAVLPQQRRDRRADRGGWASTRTCIVFNIFAFPLALVQRIHGETRALPGGRRRSPSTVAGVVWTVVVGRRCAASATSTSTVTK